MLNLILILTMTVIPYLYIGYMAWLAFECKCYDDGYTRWRKGSFKVYFFFWPILIIKSICRAFKELWNY